MSLSRTERAKNDAAEQVERRRQSRDEARKRWEDDNSVTNEEQRIVHEEQMSILHEEQSIVHEEQRIFLQLEQSVVHHGQRILQEVLGKGHRRVEEDQRIVRAGRFPIQDDAQGKPSLFLEGQEAAPLLLNQLIGGASQHLSLCGKQLVESNESAMLSMTSESHQSGDWDASSREVASGESHEGAAASQQVRGRKLPRYSETAASPASYAQITASTVPMPACSELEASSAGRHHCSSASVMRSAWLLASPWTRGNGCERAQRCESEVVPTGLEVLSKTQRMDKRMKKRQTRAGLSPDMNRERLYVPDMDREKQHVPDLDHRKVFVVDVDNPPGMVHVRHQAREGESEWVHVWLTEREAQVRASALVGLEEARRRV